MDLAPLYEWYRREQRQLPFRYSRDPYAVWVSEVMLQQTRVAAMLSRYEDFLRLFPDIFSLATAPLEKVLSAWRGLGYYSRARNLRSGAQQVLSRWGGRFPSTMEEALQIKGVGSYTASAILSICYDATEAVIDGNVRRSLTRLFYCLEKPAEIEQYAHQLMQARGKVSPGIHNQAMMELGAMICVPGRPDCGRCPLQRQCSAWLTGGVRLAASLPAKRRSKALPLALDLWLLHSRRGDQALALREKNSHFLKNLWFFPYRFQGNPPFPKREAAAFLHLLPKLSLRPSRRSLPLLRHSITHYRLQIQVQERYLTGLAGSEASLLRQLEAADSKDDPIEWRWMPLDAIDDWAVSSLSRKVVGQILKQSNRRDEI